MIDVTFVNSSTKRSRRERGSLPPLAPPPRQARGIEKRERLYEAALAEFDARGFDGSRVEDIVARAQTSWGSFFRYFMRKEDVLLHAGAIEYRRRVRPLVEAGLLEDRPVRGVALEAFRALLSSQLPPHVHGALLREIMATPDRFAEVLGPDEPPFLELIARVIALGQERGEVTTAADALSLAAVLVAGTLFVTIQGGFADLRGLRGLPDAESPETVLERAFAVAWRAMEP